MNETTRVDMLEPIEDRGGAAQPLLAVKGLTKHFPVRGDLFSARKTVRAVDDVSFSVLKGETVGIILEAQQAEAILEKGQADLIAIGRQSQFNPNIAHHWAHDLGINRRFEDWSSDFGWWLEKRIRTMDGFATPTGVVTQC